MKKIGFFLSLSFVVIAIIVVNKNSMTIDNSLSADEVVIKADTTLDAKVSNNDFLNSFSNARADESLEEYKDRMNNLEKELVSLQTNIFILINAQKNNAEMLLGLSDQLAQSSLSPEKSNEELNIKIDEQHNELIEKNKRDEQSVAHGYLLENALSNEEVDVEWANDTVDLVQQGFESDELTGFNLNNISCGSTICQLDIELDENMSPQESLQKLSTNRAWNGETSFAMDSNGKLTLYFSRDGHSLPSDSGS